jgi:hypothetical protein
LPPAQTEQDPAVSRAVLGKALAVLSTVPEDTQPDDRYSIALELLPLYHHPRIGVCMLPRFSLSL